MDRIVAYADADADADAVRRQHERTSDHEVSIWQSESGMAELHGRLLGTDAAALDRRLDALAATVCDGDPRTAEAPR